MKQLQKSDLKHGDIYVAGESMTFINKEGTNYYIGYSIIRKPNFYKTGGFTYNAAREATLEEKHWLETCIKADKFVSYEEAIKTFIPEYVECVRGLNSATVGKIYKVIDASYCESNSPAQKYSWQTSDYKPSTKEAYEAQFVVKEPEFVLPEIWWVRITQENLEDIYKFLGFKPYEKAVGYIAGMVKHYRTGKIEKSWNSKPTTDYGSTFGDEITTEQFRKYVLKIEDENTSKFIDDTTVINKEGEVFKVGDVIKSMNGNLKDKIISFRWKNDKSEICAVLPNIPNGIGIDKIELYIEPRQELSLLEQAKLKYPVGTKIISPTSNSLFTIKGNIRYGFPGSFTEDYIFGNDGECTLYVPHENKWAEIVEDFVLPEKWCIKDVKEVKEFFENYNHGGYTCSNNAYLHYPRIVDRCYFKEIQKDYTEITLEQFKKYVLNEKV